MQRDGLELWVTLVEVGGNLDAVQQRSAGPGVVPSASEAVVSAALFLECEPGTCEPVY